MSKTLSVFIKGKHAGIITTDCGSMTFRYDDNYNDVPLSMSMPASNQEYGQKYIMPWLDGVISSDTIQRRSLQRRYDLDKPNPIDILTKDGLECAGAVQFTNYGEEDRLNTSHIELVNRPYIAELTLMDSPQIGMYSTHAGRTDPWAAPGMHWSLSGCQGKGVYVKCGDEWFAPFDAAVSTHIIKPGVIGLAGEAFTEAWTMRLAQLCGIATANVEYSFFDGYPAIIVERFDREDEHRIHQEDFCQLLHYCVDKKYSDHGGPSTVDMLNGINQYTDKYKDYSLIEFTKQLFFNYLTLSTDGHAQNYSMQILGDGAKLAPMYDCATYAPYYSGGHSPLRMAMSIGGENRRGRVGIKNIKKYAIAAGMHDATVHRIMMDLIEAIPMNAEDAYFDTLVNYHRKDDSFYSEIFEKATKMIYNHCATISQNLKG